MFICPDPCGFRYSGVEAPAERYGELVAGCKPFPDIAAVMTRSIPRVTLGIGPLLSLLTKATISNAAAEKGGPSHNHRSTLIGIPQNSSSDRNAFSWPQEMSATKPRRSPFAATGPGMTRIKNKTIPALPPGLFRFGKQDSPHARFQRPAHPDRCAPAGCMSQLSKSLASYFFRDRRAA